MSRSNEAGAGRNYQRRRGLPADATAPALRQPARATPIEPFDYAALGAPTQMLVRQRAAEIRSLVRRTAQDIVDIGHKLIEVKEALRGLRGAFGRWLQAEFAWGERTAQRFVQVAEHFGNRQIVG